ncbi:trigger factor [Bordetella pseudohinzii]|uniref:Trigger factor n=1 Tax=Bordetella pseudohinzii TaxID=1331258 RepID=A0A0J6CAT5_9BORD|nr:trigger factor [Bordetella pseudohinzii]ANY16640.1 trigger factor [Bordetella pseudohinzii]KMM27801.1 trigger factor [Bordetella pseudohinzii]KXA77648.1 trigger factor [Bordetella pseudohinzii]KXA81944.1 trigger factor [Bordetella pseudohinzii]CUI29983.1 Trigger factor [Bordetella pseudohinzii]
MQPVVETLSGLERRVDLAISVADVEKEVQAQLKRVARTAKVPGFRPGKAPMAMLERSHGPSIRYDVINSQVGRAFEQAVEGAQLRVAGSPSLEPKTEGVDEGTLAFSATFEVYPEVAVPDLSALAVTRYETEVSDAEVNKTLDVLRKQRATYETREGRAAQDDDRVILDFAGTIDGVPFEGGKAEDFPFVLGQGRMLPEFEAAARGLKAGETKVFPLSFPEDYQGKEVAGKTAEFTITIKEVAEAVLPAVDAEFAKSLGQADADVEKLKADIRSNIEREVKVRSQGRTKTSVMDSLVEAAKFDVPKALVDNDVQGRIAQAREELKQRGVPNADTMPMPAEVFAAESERRVRLGLLVSELVKQAQLQAKPEQVRARIEEFAQNYEQPAQVVSYYLSDRQRRAEIEAIVLEDNVVAYVLEKAKVTDEKVPFDQLMGMA